MHGCGLIQHSLGRTPEMMVVKNRSADQWNVWFSSFNDNSSPIIIQEKIDSENIYVLMPMRV